MKITIEVKYLDLLKKVITLKNTSFKEDQHIKMKHPTKGKTILTFPESRLNDIFWLGGEYGFQLTNR
jgi:hypothetical protein